jgi:hypothetical protein
MEFDEVGIDRQPIERLDDHLLRQHAEVIADKDLRDNGRRDCMKTFCIKR